MMREIQPPERRHFNTAGPCHPLFHYMVPPLSRAPGVADLVEQGQYFVVHAPRQTGKTTLLRSLSEQLTAEGRFVALTFSCETAEPAGDDDEKAQARLLQALHFSAHNHLPEPFRPPLDVPSGQEGAALSYVLRAWSEALPRPLVLFFDEIDALRGGSLLSVLRQLRAGFGDRLQRGFPWSVALCGLRDVRDYKAASGGDPNRLGTSSPFNVKVESIRLGNFERNEVEALFAQHEEESGQRLEPDAKALVYELSAGQPWLVNALAREVIYKMGVKPPEPIQSGHLEQARERLIVARQTHLDSLVSKLYEPRVRRVIEPLLAGDVPPTDPTYDDDTLFVRDLGLIAPDNPVRPANPIYREIMVRVLSVQPASAIELPNRSFVAPDGSLLMRVVMEEFAAFWREQGELFAGTVPYHESACELVLSAWLQRIVNGGGRIERQYGLGRRRMDILVRWPPGGNFLAPPSTWQREALELKVWRDGEPDPLPGGLKQLETYLTALDLDRGWLVIFDRRTGRAPTESRTLFTTATTPQRGLAVDVIRA